MGQDFYVRVNTHGGSSQIVQGGGVKWWVHPTDEEVDVAIIPWAPPENIFQIKYISTETFLTEDVIKDKNIGTGDEVFITGLFANLHGHAKNLPIVRMGNVAMMPGEPVPTSLGPIDAYLIEARSIGGVSGSPVFVRQTVPVGTGPFYLMGLMHGQWDLPPESKNDALVADESGVSSVNMGIAIVVPAKKILEVLNHPELITMRGEAEKIMREQEFPTMDSVGEALVPDNPTHKEEFDRHFDEAVKEKKQDG